MATVKNLTPHTINICAEDGTIVKSYESEGIARAKQTAEHIGEIDGVELVSMKFGEPEDLPEFEEGVYYVVSIITANAAKAVGRRVDDLLITSDPVRDADAAQQLSISYGKRKIEILRFALNSSGQSAINADQKRALLPTSTTEYWYFCLDECPGFSFY